MTLQLGLEGMPRQLLACTPSRLATVLSYPLCIAGGYGIEWLRARWVARRSSAAILDDLRHQNRLDALHIQTPPS